MQHGGLWEEGLAHTDLEDTLAAISNADTVEPCAAKPDREDPREYQKPVLHQFGDIRSLTLGGSGKLLDASLEGDRLP